MRAPTHPTRRMNALVGGAILLAFIAFYFVASPSAPQSSSVEHAAPSIDSRPRPIPQARCKMSDTATNGLICVSDDLWERILATDKEAWARQRVFMETNVTADGPPKPLHPDDWSGIHTKWIYGQWIPTLNCPGEIRVGNVGDGGKWVCGMHELRSSSKTGNCLVYSFGSFNDFSFETDFLDKQENDCEVHVFDHTVKEWRVPEGRNIHTHNWGIDESPANSNSDLKSLAVTMEELGHRGRRLSILKIDVEGAEYPVLRNIGSIVPKPAQILVEIHVSENPNVDYSNWNAAFEALRNASYRMFHSEPNFLNPRVAIEFSFLHVAF